MPYNKRLKITEADYNRLESLLNDFLNEKDPHVSLYLEGYFQRAKRVYYSGGVTVWKSGKILNPSLCLID